MTRSVALLACMCWLAAPPRAAHAFSDPMSFALAPAAAGGGGRYFTGSPADGYTCKVCHDGGPEPALLVTGVPVGGYMPGGRYEIVVSWPLDIDKFSAAVEVTDLRGKAAGTLRLPPSDELQAQEYCEPASDQVPAASTYDTVDGRSVIGLPDCGAKRLRFLWTAPSRDVGAVWFAGSSVASNGMGDTAGDGVTDFGRVVPSAAMGSSDVISATASCSTSRAGRGRVATSWLTGVCAAAWLLCRQWLQARRRRIAGRFRP